ncbi:MAG: GNAT family N-acetyltransferase [Thermoplasmata archaeon]
MQVKRLVLGEETEILAVPALFDRPLDPEAVREYLAEDRNILLLAMERGRAVGFLRGTALGQLRSTRPQMFLYEVSVLKGFRRRGIAGKLIRSLLSYCRERGFEEVFVLTDPNNRAAVRLYRSTGALPETSADRMFVYQL